MEAYTRRENLRIFNVKEEVEENTEEVVRNLLVMKLKIPPEKVIDIVTLKIRKAPIKPMLRSAVFEPDGVECRRKKVGLFIIFFYYYVKGFNFA